MASAETNTVRLTKDNIELRRKLDAAEEEIADLKLKLSQHAKHIYSESKEGPKSLQQLSLMTSPSDPRVSCVVGTVTSEEYDALESELESERNRVRILTKELEALRAHVFSINMSIAKGDGSTPLKQSTCTAAVDTSGDRTTTELVTARRRIDELQSSEKKLRAALEDLNTALEEAAKKDTPQQHDTSDKLECVAALEEELMAEQAAAAEAAEQLELALKEVEDLRAERTDLEKRLQMAVSERNIATRVKDEALKEAAMARTELDRLRNGRKGVSAPEEVRLIPVSHNSDVHHQDVLHLKDQVRFLEQRLAVVTQDLESAKKDASRAHKAGKQAFIERQSALQNLEAWKLQHLQTFNAPESTSLPATSTAASREGPNVVAAAPSAASPTDRSFSTCAAGAVERMEAIQERLLKFDVGESSTSASGDDWAHMMYEAFFDYERQLCNLRAEVLSMQAILSLRDEESSSSATRQIRALQDEIDLLRSTLAEVRNNRQQSTVALPMQYVGAPPLGYGSYAAVPVAGSPQNVPHPLGYR